MHSKIFNAKEGLINSYKNQVNDIKSFIDCLGRIDFSLGKVTKKSESHLNNLTLAVFVSAYLEIKGYDLKNWEDFFAKENITKIKNILSVESHTESKVLELLVIYSINNVFDFDSNHFQIKALTANNSAAPSFLTDESNDKNVLTEEENRLLIQNLKVSMKIRGSSRKEIWGDNDVVVVLRYNSGIQQYCIISCKTSLRERVYQSIFWATHSRLEGTGKHVFVTTDKGDSKGKSEIGNRELDNKAKKSRDALESTMDRVYVFRNSDEVNRSQVIKDFEHLHKDLQLWAKDITGEIN